MTYILIPASAALLIVVLVYLRRVNRHQVSSLFRSTVRELLAGGMDTEPALRQAIGLFIRRPPFNILQADELTFFIQVLLDLESPVNVGAEVLQQCENRHNVLELKDAKKLTRLLYATDLRFSLRQLIQNATILHGKARERYPNIAVALLASLGVRDGWTFIEEEGDAFIFNCRKERVRLPKQESGKDAARRILFEEMTQRPMVVHAETDKARKTARQELMDGFDEFFNEVFAEVGKAG